MNQSLLDQLKENDKSVFAQMAQGVIDGEIAVQDLMDIFACEDKEYNRHRQRVSWPLSYLSEKAPETLYPVIPQMIELIRIDRSDASFGRNVFRFWQNMTMPPEFESEVYELAFAYLSDPQQPTAIKVFAMTTCAQMAKKYPELAHEIIPVIEEFMPHGTAGYINRGNKTLSLLRKLINE